MSKETTMALAQVQQSQSVQAFSAWDSPANFETAQRMAKMLSASTMVPERYRGNIGDCVIALEMSRRIGANVLATMQNLYMVHGSPAWSSQFLIACVNASGKFTPLRYRMTGERGKDSHGCVAWAEDGRGEKLESPEVTIGMAKAEGWVQKRGSKWQTMPDLMLRYRAATLFCRLFAPELTMGIRTDDEVIDIGPVVTDPRNAPAKPNFLTVLPAPAEPEHDDSNPDLGPAETDSAPEQPRRGSQPGSQNKPKDDPEATADAEPPGNPFDELEKRMEATGMTWDMLLAADREAGNRVPGLQEVGGFDELTKPKAICILAEWGKLTDEGGAE